MKPMSNDSIACRVAEFVLTRKLEELSILTGQKIAETLGLDLLKMTSAFKLEQHIPLERFIVREKIYRAFFLIERNHTITIEELTKKMGFLKTHEFVKEFESFFLIDPGRYKQLVQLK